VSPAAAETLSIVLGRSLSPVLLGNAVDPDRFARPQRPGMVDRCPVICFVGRHETRKGLRTLLLAASLIRRPVNVRIIGDGPERHRLECTFRHTLNPTWLGEVDDDTVASELAAADLFVAPSLGGESFGLVLLEAMAAGVPVIASDLPAYRLVANGAAFLVPPDEPRTLARAISNLLDDPNRRQAYVAAGRERVAESTFRSLARDYRLHYRELVELQTHCRLAPATRGTSPRPLP
jgi:phosphatidyl-myo-inositol alpha-mannosyltransferase